MSNIYIICVYYLLCYVYLNKMSLNHSIYNNGINAYSDKSIKSKNQSIAFFV